MILKNHSHRDDEWLLYRFHWCRRQLGIRGDTVRVLVTTTRTKHIPNRIAGFVYWLISRSSWRGRWTRKYGWGDKIRVSVAEIYNVYLEEQCWIEGFAHELWHTTGASEEECVKMGKRMARDWRHNVD